MNTNNQRFLAQKILNQSGYEATGCLNATDAYDALYDTMCEDQPNSIYTVKTNCPPVHAHDMHANRGGNFYCYFTRSCQNATELAAATFRESTP